MQIIFENGNAVVHTRKIYTVYENLNGQFNYLGQGYVFWYLTISVLSEETSTRISTPEKFGLDPV